MAVIPTYNENPEAGQLNGTTKVSTGGSPVAQALQGLGGAVQNVGQVAKQIDTKIQNHNNALAENRLNALSSVFNESVKGRAQNRQWDEIETDSEQFRQAIESDPIIAKADSFTRGTISELTKFNTGEGLAGSLEILKRNASIEDTKKNTATSVTFFTESKNFAEARKTIRSAKDNGFMTDADYNAYYTDINIKEQTHTDTVRSLEANQFADAGDIERMNATIAEIKSPVLKKQTEISVVDNLKGAGKNKVLFEADELAKKGMAKNDNALIKQAGEKFDELEKYGFSKYEIRSLRSTFVKDSLYGDIIESDNLADIQAIRYDLDEKRKAGAMNEDTYTDLTKYAITRQNQLVGVVSGQVSTTLMSYVAAAKDKTTTPDQISQMAQEAEQYDPEFGSALRFIYSNTVSDGYLPTSKEREGLTKEKQMDQKRMDKAWIKQFPKLFDLPDGTKSSDVLKIINDSSAPADIKTRAFENAISDGVIFIFDNSVGIKGIFEVARNTIKKPAVAEYVKTLQTYTANVDMDENEIRRALDGLDEVRRLTKEGKMTQDEIRTHAAQYLEGPRKKSIELDIALKTITSSTSLQAQITNSLKTKDATAPKRRTWGGI